MSQCGPASERLFPSSLHPQTCEIPGACALILGWLCHSREEGVATKISTVSMGDCTEIVPFSQVLDLLSGRVCGIFP